MSCVHVSKILLWYSKSGKGLFSVQSTYDVWHIDDFVRVSFSHFLDFPQFTVNRYVAFNCSELQPGYIECASYPGADGMLLCQADGNPSPTVNITTNGVNDTSNVNFGTGSDITFTSVMSQNAGRYICNASSNIGFVTREFRFFVGGQLLFVWLSIKG